MNSVGRTWVEVAMGLVCEGHALRGIESLLFRSPQLIDTHYDELLSPGGVDRFNFPGIIRADYALIIQAYEVDKNRADIFQTTSPIGTTASRKTCWRLSINQPVH